MPAVEKALSPTSARSFSRFLTSSLTGLLGVTAFVFLSLPVAALVIRAVQSRAWENVPGSAIPDAIWLSFITTLLTLLLTLIFGTPLAFILARTRFPFKRLVSVFVELPIVLPPAVAGLALLLTFGRRGLVGGALDSIGITIPFTPFAVILAQTFVAAPFYIRAAQVGFLSVSKEIEDAARVDGAPSLALFLRITLPLSSRALAAGLILCWARALGEFGATILFAGSLQGRTQTMPLLIYNIIERDLDAAVWTGLILIALALVAMIISQALARSAVEDNAAYEIM
jgi:molybdate transport system permease protein